MIRFRRGVLPSPFITATPCRRSERSSIGVAFKPGFDRNLTFARRLQKQTDSSYFWPSRPDFLPTKAVKTGSSTRLDGGERRNRLAQSIKRYRPIGGAKISLPPPEGITYLHASLYTSIAKVEVDTVWVHFISHLNDLSKNKATPLDSALFDALFWLVATENFTSVQRHEEVCGRVEVLLAYASSQVDYGLTRLQLHRTVYIWATLWEQCDVKQTTFTQSGFTETIIKRLNELDSRLASRVFSRLLSSCKTSEELGNILDRIKVWLKVRHFKVSRREVWASTTVMESPDDNVYFKEEHCGALDDQMWKVLLQRCFHIGNSKTTRSAGLLAIQQAELDASLDYVSEFLTFLGSTRLWNLLPTEVRDGAAAIDNIMKIPPPRKPFTAIPLDEVSSKKKEEYRPLSDNLKNKLAYAVAFVLATRKHYSAALYLYEGDKHKVKTDDRSTKKVEMYTAAANACARLALYGHQLNFKHEIETPQWTLIQLQRGLRLFIDCDWYESRSRSVTSKFLINALWDCIIVDRKKAAVQSTTKWLLLLRQFTTVLLTHDPKLATIQSEENNYTYSRLIGLHIYLQDYPFAKRLFLANSMKEDQIKAMKPFLFQDDFLWIFQQSMEKEIDAQFTSQLFNYWTNLEVGVNQSFYLEPLPPSLLRLYFWKLKASKKERVAIEMLHRNLDIKTLSGKGKNNRAKGHPTHAVRLMRTFFAAGSDSFGLSLDMADDLLKFWIEKEKKHEQSSTLIHLYSIAIQRSTACIDESDQLLLLRSKIMALFKSFQDHFATFYKVERFSLARKCKGSIEGIYACALKTLMEEKETRPVNEMAGELTQELEERWGIKKHGSQLWSLRIEALLVGSHADIDQARILYAQALDSLDELDKEEGNGTLSASVTSNLMMALARRGDYKDALNYVTIYQNHAGPYFDPLQSLISNAFIEGAHIAILQMQGNFEEALQKFEVLKGRGESFAKDRENNIASANWHRLFNKVTASLEARLLNQREEQQWGENQYDSPIVIYEEERKGARMYRAMAAGQPWKRAWAS